MQALVGPDRSEFSVVGTVLVISSELLDPGSVPSSMGVAVSLAFSP